MERWIETSWKHLTVGGRDRANPARNPLYSYFPRLKVATQRGGGETGLIKSFKTWSKLVEIDQKIIKICYELINNCKKFIKIKKKWPKSDMNSTKYIEDSSKLLEIQRTTIENWSKIDKNSQILTKTGSWVSKNPARNPLYSYFPRLKVATQRGGGEAGLTKALNGSWIDMHSWSYIIISTLESNGTRWQKHRDFDLNKFVPWELKLTGSWPLFMMSVVLL